MTTKQVQSELFPGAEPPEDTRLVNDRCLLRTRDGHRLVIVSGIVLWQYTLCDRVAEGHAMVSLVEQGWAEQKEVARAFGCDARTLRRYQRKFEDGGLTALVRGDGYPRGRRRLRRSRVMLVHRLKSEGHSNREVARRLGVDEKAVRKLLRRMGWRGSQEEAQLSLPLGESADPNLSALSEGTARGADPNLSAFSISHEEQVFLSLDKDPARRRLDRVLARLGLIDDAAPLFRSDTRVPYAGVLLAVPSLVESGVFECAREVYGSIGPAFYGLRTSILALLLMALLRIKRPEGLKEHPPRELGRILGLDRAPEVKTLRRKLSRLAALGMAVPFGRALAERRVALRGTALGFLYVDGHIRVYHGERKLPKAHVSRVRRMLPATTDYWVNDAAGDPLFVVTAEANASLVTMLPMILTQVRSMIGERRLTVIFDRGGYSAKLFSQLVAEGFDFMTYRKWNSTRVAASRFREHTATLDGRKVTYTLADQGVQLLDGRLRLRQVTRLCDDGHHTPILTSRRDLSAVEIAFRMFERWRQENFFKYLREEYALDALVDYKVEPDDPTREIRNPLRRAVEAELKQARGDLAMLHAEYGREALENLERPRPTMRDLKIAKGKLARVISTARKRIDGLKAKLNAMPRRVPVSDVKREVVKLAPEQKHLTNLLKMVAYQAESDLVRLVAPYYRRVEQEGRTLIQSALSSEGNLEVTDRELRVMLAPLSSAHRTRAVAALCQELNRSETIFPGSCVRLKYSVRSPS